MRRRRLVISPRRASVSRRTFYELFANREECLAAVLEDLVGQIGQELAAAGLDGLPWRERVRAGLWAILSFFDREPALARVCVVQALRGGPRVLERREEILAGLAAVVDEGRNEGPRGAECTPLTAEGLVGAAFAIVYARLLRGEQEPLAALLGELMGMIVLPYLGPAAARREQARPAPAAHPSCARSARVGRRVRGDPLRDVPMRLTYRTARVLGVHRRAAGCEQPHGRRITRGSRTRGRSRSFWRDWSESACSSTPVGGTPRASRTPGTLTREGRAGRAQHPALTSPTSGRRRDMPRSTKTSEEAKMKPVTLLTTFLSIALTFFSHWW